MYCPMAMVEARRGLQPLPPNRNTHSSGGSVRLCTYGIDKSSSSSSTNSDSDETVILGWQGKETCSEVEGRVSSSNSSKSVLFKDSGLNMGSRKEKEGWTLWSIWSDEFNQLLNDIHGRRIQIEEETFVAAILTAIQNKCPDFPVDTISKDCEVFKLNHSNNDSGIYFDEVDESTDEIRVEATPIVFRLAEKKAATKKSDGSTIFISCVGRLSDIFAHVLVGNEIVIIHGGVMLMDNNNKSSGSSQIGDSGPVRVLDLNNINTWKMPVHIIRISPTPISDGNGKGHSHGCTLFEIIQPDVSYFYFFKYMASMESQKKSVEIKRCRKFKTGSYEKPCGPLDGLLFPMMKDGVPSEAFNSLIEYESKDDPTWPLTLNRFAQKSNVKIIEREYVPAPIRYYNRDLNCPALPPLQSSLLSMKKKNNIWDFKSSSSGSTGNGTKKLKQIVRSSRGKYCSFRLFLASAVILVISITIGILYNTDMFPSVGFIVSNIFDLKERAVTGAGCQLCQNFDASVC